MDEAGALGCRAIQFIGGEPTLHPQFLRLMGIAREKGFERLEVYTNATRLTPALCSALRSCGANVAVSFYSAKAERHDAVTVRRGSFARTVRGIRTAVDAGLTVRVGMVDFADDQVSDVEAGADLVRGLGVSSIKIDKRRKIGRAAPTQDPMKELCGACGNGCVAINAKGAVSPCVFSHFYRLGHVSDGLAELVESGVLQEFRQRLGEVSGSSCTPDSGPHECSPSSGPGDPCFPTCDPSMCDPISCPPRD
jgi:MoaA/NifB/PqqE/SkfB family radical SAM enzyme